MVKKIYLLFIFVYLLVLILSVISAANLLSDPGFESDNPTGTYPSSGLWSKDWSPTGAGAIVTTTAARTGNGLWTYTDASASIKSFSSVYQDISAAQGDVFNASAYIRYPSGQPWVSGSFALVRLEFLNSAGSVLTSVDSNSMSTANTNWQQYSLISSPAPSGTAKVRFRLYVEKPAGTTAQTIVNFDDSFLDKTTLSIRLR